MQTWYHGDLNDEMVDKYFSNLINKRYLFSVLKKLIFACINCTFTCKQKYLFLKIREIKIIYLNR